MSCHDIGRGMDSVTKVVIGMYDNGELNRNIALRLFTALKKGVNWCDGNTDEAVASIMYSRCGNCLKKMTTGEKFYNIFDASMFVTNNPWDILNNYKEDFAGWYFCQDCFDKIIETVSEGKIPGKDARNYIEETCKEHPEDFICN